MSNSHIVSNPSTPAQSTFLDGARDALVIVFTYLPVAFAFGVAMASIGVSAICAMFTIATLPPLFEHHDRIFAMSFGFLALIVFYALSKKIILATLTAALIYGILFTYVHF